MGLCAAHGRQHGEWLCVLLCCHLISHLPAPWSPMVITSQHVKSQLPLFRYESLCVASLAQLTIISNLFPSFYLLLHFLDLFSCSDCWQFCYSAFGSTFYLTICQAKKKCTFHLKEQLICNRIYMQTCEVISLCLRQRSLK